MKSKGRIDWLEMAAGVLLILLGIFTFISPVGMMEGILVIYGIIALISGVADIALYIKTGGHTGPMQMTSLIMGVLTVMVGVMLIAHPAAGSWIVSILFSIWVIAHCLSRLSHIAVMKPFMSRGAVYAATVLNVIGILLGVMMFIDPLISLISIGYVMGAFLLLSGIDSIVRALNSN